MLANGRVCPPAHRYLYCLCLLAISPPLPRCPAVSQAFAALPADFLAYLLANPSTALTQVLLYHVLPTNLPAHKIVDNTNYATVEGENVTAHINGGHVFFNRAQVISADNFASNGVAHIIDSVLLPVNWTQWF
jgi:uncharacterized surface protein with fasciclin (FAS1) repeats